MKTPLEKAIYLQRRYPDLAIQIATEYANNNGPDKEYWAEVLWNLISPELEMLLIF